MVGSDTRIVHSFHYCVILGFSSLFVFSLTNQTPCFIVLFFLFVLQFKVKGENLAASSFVSPAFSVIYAFCLARNSVGDKCWSHPSAAWSTGAKLHIITNKTISFSFIFNQLKLSISHSAPESAR